MSTTLAGLPLPAATIDYPTAFEGVVPAAPDPIDGRPPRDSVIAMVAAPWDQSRTATLLGLPLPSAMIDYPDAFEGEISGGVATVTAATRSFTSDAFDDPANTAFPAALVESFNFEIALFEGLEPSGRGRSAAGEIALDNTAGLYDDDALLGWDTRRVDLYRRTAGADTTRYNRTFRTAGGFEVPRLSRRVEVAVPSATDFTFSRVARLTTDGVTYNRGRVNLRLRDQAARLYAQQLLAARYDGTGRTNGDAGVAGQFKPRAYGRLFNVRPRLIDAANQVWQWHDGAVQSVTAARDGGAALFNVGDFDDWDALLAATLTLGEFATCDALGLVRLGGQTVFGLRIDGAGDRGPVNGFGYVETRASIARRLATSVGALALTDPLEIDTLAFQTLDARQAAPIGVYYEDETSVGEALDGLMSSALCWWFVRIDGRMTVGDLREPGSRPRLILDHPGDTVGEPSMDVWMPPRQATRVGWSQSRHPQSVAELAGSLSDVERRLYGDEWRWAEASDPAVATAYPSAVVATMAAGFAEYGGARAEAARQQQIRGVRRQRWRWPANVDPFVDIYGQTVRVDGFDRYGFGSSKSFICVGVEAVNSLGATILHLWG